ncbi:MAG: thiosulfate oxidation carrier protein SoxY [Casimicrobiaceae bacterium]
MYAADAAVPIALDPARRILLKAMGVAGLAGLGMGCDIITKARAANVPDWPADAFSKKNPADATKALYDKTAEKSDKITLDVPEIAENGAVVPVTISVTLPDVTSIAILIAENPFTLAATYRIPPGTQASVACRLKMAKTSKVIALVESGGKLYSTAKDVKVTLGGCGG